MGCFDVLLALLILPIAASANDEADPGLDLQAEADYEDFYQAAAAGPYEKHGMDASRTYTLAFTNDRRNMEMGH
jgi:hypothetical protein